MPIDASPEAHPAANVFPMIDGPEFDELCEDIRERGLMQPIVMYQGRVLDGRNRLRACEVAGVEPSFTEYTGDDPVAFVVSLNVKRRHLSESQLSLVAAKIATLRAGNPSLSIAPTGAIDAPTQDEAAKDVGVSRRSVQRARVVLDHGAPELVAAVERGTVKVSDAARIAKEPVEKQRAAIEKVTKGEARTLTKAAPRTTRPPEDAPLELHAAEHDDEIDEAPAPAGRRRSRPARWSGAIADARSALESLRAALEDLAEIRIEYETWRENLPENLECTALAEKLDGVLEIEPDTDVLQEIDELLDSAESVELPLGFGRD